MRVERVAENDVRSLKEEMAGLKKKYKDDKQAYADKMVSLTYRFTYRIFLQLYLAVGPTWFNIGLGVRRPIV